MGSAKYIALIGAILGILSVLLSLLLPESLSWYRLYLNTTGGSYGYFLHGLGFFVASEPTLAPIPPGTEEMVLLGLIGGILVLVGAVACIIGIFKGMKSVAVIGGLLMIIGPLLIVLDMLIGLSDFSELVKDRTLEEGFALILGKKSPYAGLTIRWGLWIGSYLALGGGLMGLIGGTGA